MKVTSPHLLALLLERQARFLVSGGFRFLQLSASCRFDVKDIASCINKRNLDASRPATRGHSFCQSLSHFCSRNDGELTPPLHDRRREREANNFAQALA